MNTSSELQCWRCGAGLAQITLPLRRLEECPSCHSELHVCRMCEFFDPGVAESCREPVAGEVRDKERANFCDYLRLSLDAYKPRSDPENRAASQLKSLFGEAENDAPQNDDMDALENLFKKPDA